MEKSILSAARKSSSYRICQRSKQLEQVFQRVVPPYYPFPPRGQRGLGQERCQQEGREGICYQADKTASGYLGVLIWDGSVGMHHRVKAALPATIPPKFGDAPRLAKLLGGPTAPAKSKQTGLQC